jgi:hypothetical protein
LAADLVFPRSQKKMKQSKPDVWDAFTLVHGLAGGVVMVFDKKQKYLFGTSQASSPLLHQTLLVAMAVCSIVFFACFPISYCECLTVLPSESGFVDSLTLFLDRRSTVRDTCICQSITCKVYHPFTPKDTWSGSIYYCCSIFIRLGSHACQLLFRR